MAQSLPVVATEVGSIPHFVKGAAKLVPPRNLKALTGAIRELVNSPTQRRHCIRSGRALATTVTLEKQVKEMFATMKSWLGENRPAAA
jgi:glycosyltransferase involved in cell wall biosynthesis